MNAVRQSCRPKHQVLVLKCYPRFQKNQTSVKPNGSELSYLLYYASTRRSKLQKLGSFLEKRTVTDVYHQRIGNVQVGLQIVRALIEKCGRDLPLFAGSVLRILRTVLRSGDVTMAESTAEVWDYFCKVQDPAKLAADQEYISQYEEIVQLYVAFASKDKPFKVKGQDNVPTSMRFRKLGLDAIKSIVESQITAAETPKQLNLIIPAILENLYSVDPVYLQILQQREFHKEQAEKAQAMRRRQSISTVRTAEDSEKDPTAALGTTEEGDIMAEQDIGIAALQALRTIFQSNSRGLLRYATASVLRFVSARVSPKEHFNSQEYHTLQLGTWPTNLFGELCGWASVQDRFVILVTAMELLIRSPIAESGLQQQYVVALIVGWLLSSQIYFIGLSVMDVLLGLLQHISLLLQLGGSESEMRPHGQQPIMFDIGTAPGSAGAGAAAPALGDADPALEVVETASQERVQLLNQLLQCIGNLATHVYYSDQISDMLAAILRRLKPSSTHNPSIVSAIEDPSATVETLARTVSVKEKPNTDHFFSFDTARVAALQAVKAIVIVANSRAADGTSNASGRSQIGTSVWEGTQWLLRDPSYEVRVAYHDALVTWLDLESRRTDLKVAEPTPLRKPSEKKAENGSAKGDLARRAVSNASRRDKSPGAKRNTFLDLLHLAVYENVHQYGDRQSDILMLHSLLASLVHRLGVNSVRSGLPMIMCLQNEIPAIEPAQTKINVASLVHGYFWALAVYFDFDASATARTVLNEITRRTHDGNWLQSIRVPPLQPEHRQQAAVQLAHMVAPSSDPTAEPTEGAAEKVDTDAFKPFDNKGALIDKIAQGYSMSLYSPPSSPPGSPNRSFSVPMLGTVGRTKSSLSQHGSALRAPSPNRGPPELPQRVRDELLHDWSRESCIANATKENSRSTAGSFAAGGSVIDRNRSAKHLALGASPGSSNGNSVHGAHNIRSSDLLPFPRSPHQPLTPTSASHVAVRPRSQGGQDSPDPPSASSVRSAVRIEDLKRVLAGATAGGGALRTAWSMRGSSAPRWSASRDSGGEGDADTGSDSMISADASSSDLARATSADATVGTAKTSGESEDDERTEIGKLSASEGYSAPRPGSGHNHANSEDTIRPFLARKVDPIEPAALEMEDEDIPPVPRIPSDFDLERRGRQEHIDTDAESSVYATPGESPAPLERELTNDSTGSAETATAEAQDEPRSGVETPKATRKSYFNDPVTPSPQQQKPIPDSPETARAAQAPRAAQPPGASPSGLQPHAAMPREIGVEKRRSVSAHNRPQNRAPMVRSVSSGARNANDHGAAATTSGKRASSLRHPGIWGGRRVTLGPGQSDAMMRTVAGGLGSLSGPAGPVNVRALLDGIEVDGYGGMDRAVRRPPY